MSDVPVPEIVRDEPEMPPKFRIPAPVIVAVIDSGCAIPLAFLVRTEIRATAVAEAVASAVITSSAAAFVSAPMNAVDEAGAIVVEADARAATTMLTSVSVVDVTTADPALYTFVVTVYTYVPAVRAVADSNSTRKFALTKPDAVLRMRVPP